MGSTLSIGKNCPWLLYHSLLNELISWFHGGSKCIDMEYQREQDCVTERKNLLCSSTLCYGAKFISEVLCTKYWNFHATSYSNAWKQKIRFIHVAIQNFTTIHRAQDISWTTENFQLCCMSDHCSEISGPIWLEIHCFSLMSWPLSWLIMVH